MHNPSESTSLSSANNDYEGGGPGLLSGYVTDCQPKHTCVQLLNLPSEKLDFDPIGQYQSPVSDRVQGRLTISSAPDLDHKDLQRKRNARTT